MWYFQPEFLFYSLVLCIALGIFAYWKQILDLYGSIAAVVIGVVIAVFADIYWLLTLIFFLIITYGVTKFDYKYKELNGVAQPDKGRRHIENVLANGTVPAVIAVLSPFITHPIAGVLFITAICIAASDSFASELGVFSTRTYLITKPRTRVPRGTDGGVSLLGQLAAVEGALIPAFIGGFILTLYSKFYFPLELWTLLIPIVFGFIGCQLDSLFGATLQQKHKLTNEQVNILSITTGVILAWLTIYLLF